MRLSAVLVEDSTLITLPAILADIWKGCGERESTSSSSVKAFACWDMLNGELHESQLSNGRMNDHKSPFKIDELPEGSLSLADLGFFVIERLCHIARGKKGKRYFVTRFQAKTNLYTHRGYRIQLAGILSKQVGQVQKVGVVLGQKNGLASRLIGMCLEFAQPGIKVCNSHATTLTICLSLI